MTPVDLGEQTWGSHELDTQMDNSRGWKGSRRAEKDKRNFAGLCNISFRGKSEPRKNVKPITRIEGRTRSWVITKESIRGREGGGGELKSGGERGGVEQGERGKLASLTFKKANYPKRSKKSGGRGTFPLTGTRRAARAGSCMERRP